MGNARWTSALSEIEDRWVSGMAKQQKPGRTLGGDFDYLEKWGFLFKEQNYTSRDIREGVAGYLEKTHLFI